VCTFFVLPVSETRFELSVPSGNIDFQLLGGTVERYNPLHVVHDDQFRLPTYVPNA